MFDLISRRRGEGRELSRFREELESLFTRFFDREHSLTRGMTKGEAWSPRLDMSENAKTITVRAELPGCEAEDIDVRVEGRHLTIKGEKGEEKEDKDAHSHRVERTYGFFSRTLELPTDIDADDVEAIYKRGVLKIVLKKTKSDNAKKIKVIHPN
jgi:HSP20 family protein